MSGCAKATVQRAQNTATRAVGGPGRHQSAKAQCQCDDCKHRRGMLQRSSINHHTPTEVPSIVYDVLRAPGQPLHDEVRGRMEKRFGYDFSGVRVHSDTRAAESANVIGAKAYTVGSDIAFANGEYRPSSAEGIRLLAHELVHVIQGGRERERVGRGKIEFGLVGSRAESDALLNGDRAARGEPTKVSERSRPWRLQKQASLNVVTPPPLGDQNDCGVCETAQAAGDSIHNDVLPKFEQKYKTTDWKEASDKLVSIGGHKRKSRTVSDTIVTDKGSNRQFGIQNIFQKTKTEKSALYPDIIRITGEGESGAFTFEFGELKAGNPEEISKGHAQIERAIKLVDDYRKLHQLPRERIATGYLELPPPIQTLTHVDSISGCSQQVSINGPAYGVYYYLCSPRRKDLERDCCGERKFIDPAVLILIATLLFSSRKLNNDRDRTKAVDEFLDQNAAIIGRAIVLIAELTAIALLGLLLIAETGPAIALAAILISRAAILSGTPNNQDNIRAKAT